jgi:hypothetical protein
MTGKDSLLDMSAFHSRLVLRGTLKLRTGLRLGIPPPKFRKMGQGYGLICSK